MNDRDSLINKKETPALGPNFYLSHLDSSTSWPPQVSSRETIPSVVTTKQGEANRLVSFHSSDFILHPKKKPEEENASVEESFKLHTRPMIEEEDDDDDHVRYGGPVGGGGGDPEDSVETIEMLRQQNM